MVYLLDKNYIAFPDPHYGEPDGLFAIGGDLSVERLQLAYSHGIFPWYDFRGAEIHWYCPMQRFVIFPDEIHISHSMRTLMNKGIYSVSINKRFDEVIRACGTVDGRYDMPGAWLGENIIEAYTRLHDLDCVASVEVEDLEGNLVGGLYGVLAGRCFIGESMFSKVPSGSKLALIALAQFLQECGGLLIDCQIETAHLRSMGGRYISYEEYIKILHTK